MTVPPPAHAGPPADAGAPPRWRRRLRRIAQALALVALLGVPWWGRAALRRLDFFHVRSVEVTGARYLDPADVVRRLAVDTLRSIWDELAPLEQRVLAHPQVRAVTIDRRLPGTLHVRVEEHAPVAFAPAASGMRVLDARGRELPIDPSRIAVDLPIVAADPDTTLLRVLGELRAADSAFYGRVSEARRVGRDELAFRLPETTVRVRPSVGARRFADLRPVEADLARRQLRATELDLRFRDQVIARFQ